MADQHLSEPTKGTDSSSLRLADNIAKLRLSVRAFNALSRAGITTIGELKSLSEDQILAVRNLGNKSLDEIKMILAEASLSLCESPEGEPSPAFRSIPTRELQAARPVSTLGLLEDTTTALIRHGFGTIGSLLSASVCACIISPVSSEAWANTYEKCKRSIAWLTQGHTPHAEHRPGTKLRDIGLGVRPLHSLGRAGISTLEQVLALTFGELVAIHQLGGRSVGELFDTLREMPQEELERLPEPHAERKSPALPYSIGKKLSEAGITKFSVLSDQTRESLITNCGLTYQETFILQEAMSRAGIDLSEQWPSEPLVTESDFQFLARLGVPLDSIPIARLALPRQSEARLKELGYYQVGQLARESILTLQSVLGSHHSSSLPQVKRNLSQYLHWLSLQSSWESEINNEDLSPLYYRWLEETTVTDIVKKHLARLSKREIEIIVKRHNLDGRGKRTLDEVGESFGLTRERIRQLQMKAERRLAAIITDRLCVAYLNLMHRAISTGSGLLSIHGLVEASEAYGVRLGHMDGPALIDFLLELDYRFMKDRSTGAWGIVEYPLEATEPIIAASKSQLATAKAPIRESELLDSIRKSLCSTDQVTELADGFILACWRASDELVEEDGWWKLESWSRRRLDNLIMVLRKLGQPVHYKEIARLVNECIPENLQASERTIHAELGRHPDIFVWQESGTYGLAEWGLERKRFYVDIAAEFLEKQGKPLTFEQIFAAIIAERDASPDNIAFMLQTNPHFHQYSGSEFGLASWQKESERRQDEQDPFLEELKRRVFDDF